MVRVNIYIGENLDQVINSIRRELDLSKYIKAVKQIVEDVRRVGWEAVKKYTKMFDGVEIDDPRVPLDVLAEAVDHISEDVRWALETAIASVRYYHDSIKPRELIYEYQGIRIRLKPIPLESVGVYVPGGLHPYPSTIIMTVVPARSAGVERIVATTPPRPKDRFPADPVTLATAYLSGCDEVYTIGGAQAIAALAYGAHPYVKPVDKIVGPGNLYVVAAKLLVSKDVGIDMIAGPSEILIVAGRDAISEAKRISLDLLAQAEHGPASIAILVTDSRELAERVKAHLEEVENANIGPTYILVVKQLEDSIELVNKLAPEHVELIGEHAKLLASKIINAGAIAINMPVALADYSAGPSHVLPTSGSAKWRGGLTIYDFLKFVAFVDIVDEQAAEELVKAAIILAKIEGFRLHASSLEEYLRRVKV